MTNEQLTAYLQDESYLYSVGYEELKTLVMQYPYSANLRILLLKKSYLDQNKDYDRNLQMSATYTTNRKHLYKTIKRLKSFKFVPQNVILGEEYLELTELSNIERLLAERQVTAAVQGATKLDSLAPDWKLEIDDVAFNDEKGNGQFDLSNLSQSKGKKAKKIRTDEDEIDSLINSLVSEYNDPALNLGHKTAQEVENDTHFVADETKPEESKQVDFEELVNEKSKVNSELDVSEHLPSVSEDNFFDFKVENKDVIHEEKNTDDVIHKEENIDDVIQEEVNTDDVIHKEENTDDIVYENTIANAAIIEKENFESPLNAPETAFNINTLNSTIDDEESEEDVKKTNIELEIINSTKASIVDKPNPQVVIDKKPSFTEWLSQFRMTPPQTPNVVVKPLENIEESFDNQPVTPLATDESIRKISRQSMVEIFETKNDVPDNLYGLTDEKSPIQFVEDDDDDDDDVFSDYESNPQKKKKNRPMHQLAIKSLVQDDELVSETLADLLSWQGNKAKATEMYRKLILQFPEKSSYFATKIEKISI